MSCNNCEKRCRDLAHRIAREGQTVKMNSATAHALASECLGVEIIIDETLKDGEAINGNEISDT